MCDNQYARRNWNGVHCATCSLDEYMHTPHLDQLREFIQSSYNIDRHCQYPDWFRRFNLSGLVSDGFVGRMFWRFSANQYNRTTASWDLGLNSRRIPFQRLLFMPNQCRLSQVGEDSGGRSVFSIRSSTFLLMVQRLLKKSQVSGTLVSGSKIPYTS